MTALKNKQSLTGSINESLDLNYKTKTSSNTKRVKSVFKRSGVIIDSKSILANERTILKYLGLSVTLLAIGIIIWKLDHRLL